ncbi:uncharacterized protein LOC108154481 isoform X4 [Drosophila miranda]|uniref:uncharacterized protein LOC108154481 isoform X4 n=1 Tax=Drosophila miranda TaxID=7229 RepID=UPI0007E8379B|nr:uncharacterized protein LOC108154481 isoform X4 [Drosophila miranda]
MVLQPWHKCEKNCNYTIWRWRLPAGDQSARWPEPHIQWSHVLSGAKVPCQHQLAAPRRRLPQYCSRWAAGRFTLIDGFRFVIGSQAQQRCYLKCSNFRSKCRARAILNKANGKVQLRHGAHNHTRGQQQQAMARRNSKD